MGQAIQDIATIGSVVAAPFTAGTSLAWLPAALGGVSSITGMIDQQNTQKAENAAYQQEVANQSSALGEAENLSKQLAQGPDLQSLINAEKSGVNTLKSSIGGVANPGALIKELFGGNIENAIQAALNTRSGNLQGAINGVLSAGGEYGNMGAQTARNATQGGNPSPNLAAGTYSAVQQIGKASGRPTGTTTGMGGSTGGDVAMPAPTAIISGPDTPGAYEPGGFAGGGSPWG